MLHSENTFQQHKIKVVLKSVNYLKFSVKTVGRKIGLRENCIIFIPFNAIRSRKLISKEFIEQEFRMIGESFFRRQMKFHPFHIFIAKKLVKNRVTSNKSVKWRISCGLCFII